MDIGCGTHICTNEQGLKVSRQLGKGELDLRVSNGAKVVVAAVGSYELNLPSSLYLILDNCYYVPSLKMNIISFACLHNSGFNFRNSNGCISVYWYDVFYLDVCPHNGIYEIDL
mgnify:CR=1 FL=1